MSAFDEFPLSDDGQSQDRVCSVTGPPDKVQQAVAKIQDLLSKANIMAVSSYLPNTCQKLKIA